MRSWQVMLLLNLTFLAALGLGYGLWGQRVSVQSSEINALKDEVAQLRRQQDALAAGAEAGTQQWEGRGVVRGIYPNLIIVTHEDITGLLPARTTGFRIARDIDRSPAQLGQPIRFWLQGTTADDSIVARVEAW